MANVSEKLKRIDTNVAEMRTALGLTNANTIEELTAKVKDTATSDNNAKVKEVNSTGDLRKYITEVNDILVTSSATALTNFFSGCSNLTKISFDKNSDFSNVTDMSSMFRSCNLLATVHEMDTSNVTNMSSMFRSCNLLVTVHEMDTSNVTDMSSMFRSCNSLATVHEMDTSNVTNMVNMFNGCSSLITIPEMDTSNVTNMSYMFNSCNKLTEIPALDCSSVTIINDILLSCSSLENIGGFINLGQAYDISQSENYQYYTLVLSSTILEHDSLMNVINNLYDIATKGCNPQKLVLGSILLAKLTSEEIAIATAKGWTVS